MDFSDFRLNELPYHLDVVVFVALVVSMGLGGAWAIARISDGLSRTDRLARAAARSQPAMAAPATAGASTPGAPTEMPAAETPQSMAPPQAANSDVPKDQRIAA